MLLPICPSLPSLPNDCGSLPYTSPNSVSSSAPTSLPTISTNPPQQRAAPVAAHCRLLRASRCCDYYLHHNKERRGCRCLLCKFYRRGYGSCRCFLHLCDINWGDTPPHLKNATTIVLLSQRFGMLHHDDTFSTIVLHLGGVFHHDTARRSHHILRSCVCRDLLFLVLPHMPSHSTSKMLPQSKMTMALPPRLRSAILLLLLNAAICIDLVLVLEYMLLI